MLVEYTRKGDVFRTSHASFWPVLLLWHAVLSCSWCACLLTTLWCLAATCKDTPGTTRLSVKEGGRREEEREREERERERERERREERRKERERERARENDGMRERGKLHGALRRSTVCP